MSKEEKKNKKLGLLISSVFHAVLILLLFAFSMSTEGEKEEPVLLVMDFSAGSSSKGGSSATEAPSESVEPTPVSNVDPVKTQETESPIQKSNKQRSESSESSEKAKRKPNSGAMPTGDFGGDGTGESDGDGSGENEGIGDGENGPGIKGKTGKLGAGEGIPPAVTNPTKDQEGKVVIEITVDRKGNVTNVKVMAKDPRATTTDPILQNQARKDGYRFKFKPDNRRAEYSKGLRIISYVLR